MARKYRDGVLRTCGSLVGPSLLGVVIVVSPLTDLATLTPLLLPIGIYWEIRRGRRHGFFPMLPMRLSIIATIIALAVVLPARFEDRLVDMTSAQLTPYDEYSMIRSRDGALNVFVDERIEQLTLEYPPQPVTIAEALRMLETATGKKSRIGYCGTGASILGGPHPMIISLAEPE